MTKPGRCRDGAGAGARAPQSNVAQRGLGSGQFAVCRSGAADVQRAAFEGMIAPPDADGCRDDERPPGGGVAGGSDGVGRGGPLPMPMPMPPDEEEEVPDLVASLLMTVEEVRRELASFAEAGAPKPRADRVLRWRDELEPLVCHHLERLRQAAAAAGGGRPAATADDLWRHCRAKVRELLRQVLQASFQMREADDEEALLAGLSLEELRQDGQAAVARVTELLLGLLASDGAPTPSSTSSSSEADAGELANPDDVVRSYAQYQRSVIRQRAKPHVAQLVQQRDHYQRERRRRRQQPPALHGEDPPGAAVEGAGPTHRPPSHSATVAHVLGQAAVLVHPLLAWKSHLPPLPPPEADGTSDLTVLASLHRLCDQASVLVDEQAQLLAQTVAAWLQEDWELEAWLQRTNDNDDVGGGEGDSTPSRRDLALLDGLVEEWAFVCQSCSRYLALTQPLRGDGGSASDAFNAAPPPGAVAAPSSLSTSLPEWTWKYAALERYLVVRNWRAALHQAQPTAIVLGTDVRVPSVVEDAQYLSLRALQRASNTQSALAVGTVAHAASRDVWSAESPSVSSPSLDDDDAPTPTVHEAFVRRIGCFPVEDDLPSGPRSAPLVRDGIAGAAPRSGDFASALLSALDDEDNLAGGTKGVAPARSRRKPPSAPTSGNFLSLMGGSALDDEAAFQRQLDAEFCALNGIHAAAGACRGLASYLDSLLSLDAEADEDALLKDDKAMAMIQLAREELLRHAESYERMLDSQIHSHIETYSAVFRLLQRFFQDEEYRLTTETIATAESDERLEREMMGPLHESRFLSQLSNKLESEVCQKMGEGVIATMVQLILDVLWDSPGAADDASRSKPFTELGALLLSKQVRLLQAFVANIVSDPSRAPSVPNLSLWERLSQVVTALQLEKPSDWVAYYQTSSVLSPVELRDTLRLRVDFPPDAIQAIVKKVAGESGG